MVPKFIRFFRGITITGKNIMAVEAGKIIGWVIFGILTSATFFFSCWFAKKRIGKMTSADPEDRKTTVTQDLIE